MIDKSTDFPVATSVQKMNGTDFAGMSQKKAELALLAVLQKFIWLKYNEIKTYVIYSINLKMRVWAPESDR